MKLVRACTRAALVFGTAACGADRISAATPAGKVRPAPWIEMLRQPGSPVVPAAGTGAVIHLRCASPLPDRDAPLLVLDGRVLSHDELHALDLDPRSIENIEILKGEAAVARYGPAARNGVALVTLKR